MEIGPIPFLNQDDFSNFYSFFQELDSPMVNNGPKRRKLDFDGAAEEEFEALDTTQLKDILSTFLSFDEFEEKPNSDFEFPHLQPNSVLDFNFKTNPPQMNEISEIDSGKLTKICRQSDDISTTTTTDDSTRYPIGRNDGGAGQQQRRLWVKDRSKAWWEQYGSDDCPDEEFRKAFRMTKSTFDFICNELDSAVTKKDTMLRLAIPVRQRVAVCIYRLASGEPLRLVSKRFGLGISTCHKLVLEVCAAIKRVLMPKFLQWPEENKLMEIKKDFEGISGIPNVGGSIYTTHIPIIAPKVSTAAYFNKRHTERNQKPSYSTTVQGVVDSRRVFTDICIGWPGSMPDDMILEKSALFQRARSGLLKDVWVVGNSGYPLMDWVLAPYTHQNLTWSQHSFNEKVDELQGVAKDAFMKLKGRWTCLQKRTEVKLQDLPIVLGACCVLHNICEMRNEKMEMDLRFDLFDDEMVAENAVRSAKAMQIRGNVAHNILHHK